MHLFSLFSLVISLAAIFAFANVKVFKLPSGVALMAMSGVLSVILITLANLFPDYTGFLQTSLKEFDFSEFILGVLLSFLLFAGSLHVSIIRLREAAVSILSFATLGVLISTFLLGIGCYFLFQLFNLEIPFLICLAFGALISPTDPIAVLGILKKAGVSKSIEIKITGESLFNDGIGVVVFATIIQIITSGIENVGAGQIAILFMREAVGGIVAGIVIGYVGYNLMKRIDHFQTEILISLAMVMGGYSLCHALHVSGPLAMVVAGLITGYKGFSRAMSDTTRDYLEKFWEVIDEILNAVLFVIIGLEILILPIEQNLIWVGLLLAVLLVGVRFLSLWIPSVLLRFRNKLEKGELLIMSWGGLRGGISIALALSIPSGEYKSPIVVITYVVVLFSILVQGLTIERLARRLSTT